MKDLVVLIIVLCFVVLAAMETDIKMQIGCILLALVNGVLFL